MITEERLNVLAQTSHYKRLRSPFLDIKSTTFSAAPRLGGFLEGFQTGYRHRYAFIGS